MGGKRRAESLKEQTAARDGDGATWAGDRDGEGQSERESLRWARIGMQDQPGSRLV